MADSFGLGRKLTVEVLVVPAAVAPLSALACTLGAVEALTWRVLAAATSQSLFVQGGSYSAAGRSDLSVSGSAVRAFYAPLGMSDASQVGKLFRYDQQGVVEQVSGFFVWSWGWRSNSCV